MQVATAQFIKQNAAPGTLATLTGIAGGAHAGFGKGVGGLAGGIIIEGTKNTKMAFYYFGLYSFGCAGVALIIFAIAKLFCKKSKVAEEEVTEGDDDEAAVALQPNGEEKKNAVNKEEDIEKEMVVDVKINTMNTN